MVPPFFMVNVIGTAFFGLAVPLVAGDCPCFLPPGLAFSGLFDVFEGLEGLDEDARYTSAWTGVEPAKLLSIRHSLQSTDGEGHKGP
jgi:hypothetical protein